VKRDVHWINGTSSAPETREYLTSTSPGTDTVVCEIMLGDETDVGAAVTAAQDAFPEWRNRKPGERGRILSAIADGIRAEAGQLAELESAESGKPAWQSPIEVEGAAAFFDFYVGLANVPAGEVIDMGPGRHGYTVREPYGVVGVITPWNATTLELARIATEAGLPDGVLNVVTGNAYGAGRPLVQHSAVRKVAFTGSVRAGREIGHIAADRIIPLTLELGGKGANIVFADANLAAAAQGAITAFAVNAGQICSAGTRLLVAAEIHDNFVDALREAAKQVVPGQTYGPQTTHAQFAKVLSYFDVAEEDGATLVTGGAAVDDGWLIQPTIYAGVTNDMRIAREEIFGPVLVVIPFTNEDHAVALANDSDYGLSAGIWTTDVARTHRVAAQLDAGQIYVNEWPAGLVEGPFGGYKNSGYGREKGAEALHHYTHTKFVLVKL
jgi:aldehyde dehydrogenase (NAD+)